MEIKEDLNYQEGKRVAQDTIKFIENTVYGTLEVAIAIKTDVIERFEKTFSYTTTSKIPFDKNYAYNYGMLDAFKEKYDEETSSD